MEFLRYPHLIRQLFNGGRFGPPWGFTPTSSWTWIGHPVSGQIHATIRTFRTRFPCGFVSEKLNLAAYIYSPDHSTKGTTSSINALCVFVNTRFQGLFHSPLGVLFTFPSQYFFTIGHRVVFRLGGWAPRIHSRFHVSAATLDTARFGCISDTRLSLSLVELPISFSYTPACLLRSEPLTCFQFRFGLFRFRSPLLAKSRLISLPLPT